MARPLNDVEKAALARLSPDLQYILSERNVTVEVQLQLSQIGFFTIGLFSSLADDRASMRIILGTDFGLDPSEAGLANAAKLQRRIEMSRMIDSWETCRTRQEKEQELAAEQRASRLPLSIGKNTHVQLRQRFENEYGEHRDTCWPAQTMVERRFEEIEEGSIRAEPLTEVVNLEEAQEDPFGAVLDKDGAIRLKKAAKKVAMPSDSEELRARMKLLSVSYQLARYQHSTRPWLQTCTPQVWMDHVDFVLGTQCYGYVLEVAGHRITPTWNTVLGYEHQIRKKAINDIMYRQLDLRQALEAARRCAETRELYFTTVVALTTAVQARDKVQGTKQTWKQDTSQSNKPSGGGKGSNKKKDKGNSKGNGKGKGNHTKFKHTKTPDGRLICFRHQSNGCSSPKCGFVHVCTHCLGSHAQADCPTFKNDDKAE